MKIKQMPIGCLGILFMGNLAMANMVCYSKTKNPEFTIRTWQLEKEPQWLTYKAKALLTENTHEEELNGTAKVMPTRVGNRVSYELKDSKGELAELIVSDFYFNPTPCKTRVGCDSFNFQQSGHFSYLGETHEVTCKETIH
ncbi:MAG: hypothetical protein ACKOA8_08095 [Deltaproteobacteria bacterium]